MESKPYKELDLRCYLVTDSDLLPSGASLASYVEEAVANGVTIVQLREKHAETRDFIKLAEELHAITRKVNIPLIINDRLDVALAIDAEGIHIGQDDIGLSTARKLLGPNKIIGVSAHDEEEIKRAYHQGADYLGIGAVYATKTKDLKKAPIGPTGLRKLVTYLQLLQEAHSRPNKVKTVAIGGINAKNTQLVVYKNRVNLRSGIDGIAVVSAIIASKEPGKATSELLNLVDSPAPWEYQLEPKRIPSSDEFIAKSIPNVVKTLRSVKPMIHQIINRVVTNFAANVTLACGASPIMSECGDEFKDLASVPNSALLVNMGTVTHAGIELGVRAAIEYNSRSHPVVFDPVGGGATEIRREAVREYLNRAYFDCIKGNEGEILSASGLNIQMKGVDSLVSDWTIEHIATVVTNFAREQGTVVLLTGERDIVSDGHQTFVLSNGHSLMGEITGSGCVLGSLITSFLAIKATNKLLAVITAISLFNMAGERAAKVPSVKGPGTFVPVLIDEIKAGTLDVSWASNIKLVEIKL